MSIAGEGSKWPAPTVARGSREQEGMKLFVLSLPKPAAFPSKAQGCDVLGLVAERAAPAMFSGSTLECRFFLSLPGCQLPTTRTISGKWGELPQIAFDNGCVPPCRGQPRKFLCSHSSVCVENPKKSARFKATACVTPIKMHSKIKQTL